MKTWEVYFRNYKITDSISFVCVSMCVYERRREVDAEKERKLNIHQSSLSVKEK